MKDNKKAKTKKMRLDPRNYEMSGVLLTTRTNSSLLSRPLHQMLYRGLLELEALDLGLARLAPRPAMLLSPPDSAPTPITP